MGAPCLEMAEAELKTDSLVDCLFETLGRHKVVTAESCTGGMIASSITDRGGSSAYFERGFVTYSNEAKKESLGVSKDTLDKYGAVSAEIAEEMADGALKHSHADIAIAVTGIAGPSGGSDEKPVGLVYIGLSDRHTGQTESFKHLFSGDRSIIRAKTCIFALRYLLVRAKELQEKAAKLS
jgi:PncC family amidohydrolase